MDADGGEMAAARAEPTTRETARQAKERELRKKIRAYFLAEYGLQRVTPAAVEAARAKRDAATDAALAAVASKRSRESVCQLCIRQGDSLAFSPRHWSSQKRLEHLVVHAALESPDEDALEAIRKLAPVAFPSDPLLLHHKPQPKPQPEPQPEPVDLPPPPEPQTRQLSWPPDSPPVEHSSTGAGCEPSTAPPPSQPPCDEVAEKEKSEEKIRYGRVGKAALEALKPRQLSKDEVEVTLRSALAALFNRDPKEAAERAKARQKTQAKETRKRASAGAARSPGKAGSSSTGEAGKRRRDSKTPSKTPSREPSKEPSKEPTAKEARTSEKAATTPGGSGDKPLRRPAPRPLAGQAQECGLCGERVEGAMLKRLSHIAERHCQRNFLLCPVDGCDFGSPADRGAVLKHIDDAHDGTHHPIIDKTIDVKYTQEAKDTGLFR